MMVAVGMVRVDGFEIHIEGGTDEPQGYPGCRGEWGEVRETEKSTCLLGFGPEQLPLSGVKTGDGTGIEEK